MACVLEQYIKNEGEFSPSFFNVNMLDIVQAKLHAH